MAFNFTEFKNGIKQADEWLVKEFAGIRTGRATPTILDGVQVESYGSRMPISSIAAIATEDARTIRISPWDKTQTVEIEKAILVSNLGLSVSVDEKGLRISFPELTADRRTVLLKLARDKQEDAKVRVRMERDKVNKEILAQEKLGGMGEDERNRYKTEVDKMVQDANKVFESHFEKKEKEIQS